MEPVDHIIHAKWIITCEENNKVLENHALLIKDKRIHSIVPSKEAEEKYKGKVSHYSAHAIMPGLINAHTHVPMNLFRGLADDLALMDWLNNHIWPAEGKWVSDELVYDGSLLAMAEMIRGGTTCFNDMYFFLGATAKAAELAGLRAHIGMTVIGVPTAWAKTTDEYFEKGLAFYHEYKNHEHIRPTMAPHSTYTVSQDELVKAKEIADRYKLKMNIHLQEAPAEIEQSMANYQKRPLQILKDLNILDANLIAVHMTQINEDDFELLKTHRPSIVHCPESNMKLMSGGCPVDTLLKLKINTALGTDGAASNNDLDMFGEMRSAAFLGKMIANDPRAVSAEEVIKMATINGAKALGIEHLTGSLTPGKMADFIAIDFDQLETQPVYHPISQIVYATPRSQVTDVWVGGKQIMKNRKLAHIDEKELINKAKEWGKKIKN